jgi:hypothetical protein
MPGLETRDRVYMRARIREELGRGKRYDRPFALITFEALAAPDGTLAAQVDDGARVLEMRVRPSDVVSRVSEDTIVVLLVEVDEPGAQDALFRLRRRVQEFGEWRVATYWFPRDALEIEALGLVRGP